MNDTRLHNLLNLAREAEEFERDALGAGSGAGPSLKLTSAGPEEREALMRAMQPEGVRAARSGSNWKFRTAMALAASVAIGWFLYPAAKVATVAPAPQPEKLAGSRGSNANPGVAIPLRPKLAGLRPPVSGPRMVSVASNPTENAEPACVIVAIFKDSRGGCPCVHIQPHALAAGRSLDDLSPADLFDIHLKGSCGQTGDSLLLVAVEGPGNLLPHTAAEAQALADCVGDAPRVCDGSPGCMANMARNCLPPSVKVLAQSVQMASR